MKITYYSGTEELKHAAGIPNAEFEQIGGVRSKANSYDSFKRLAGPSVATGVLMPVTRKIEYTKVANPHKCGARCRNAKGSTCECECGGKSHGAGA